MIEIEVPGLIKYKYSEARVQRQKKGEAQLRHITVSTHTHGHFRSHHLRIHVTHTFKYHTCQKLFAFVRIYTL